MSGKNLSADSSLTMPDFPRLEVIDFSCSYHQHVANENISLKVFPGEVHGILGENGAGKSTLLKCIYGVERPDSGEMLIDARQVLIDNPATARRHGIAMVFQHFSLFDSLSVEENIALFLSVPLDKARKLAEETLSQLAFNLSLSARISVLSVAERQQVEIARCLMMKPSILLLDEPTALLAPPEVASLFLLLEQVALSGCSILFTSHKLDEVRSICNTASILRQGKVVGHCEPATMDNKLLTEMIFGDEPPPLRRSEKFEKGGVVFSIESVTTLADEQNPLPLRDVSLEVHAGEILGIAGVSGNGQEVLNALINGELCPVVGKIIFEGEDWSLETTASRQKKGVQLVPADRLGVGAVAEFSLAENFLLTQQHLFVGRFGAVDTKALSHAAQESIALFGVDHEDAKVTAGELSGGNLQKYLLARAVHANPRLLVCNNPTWGIDLQGTREVRQRIGELADRGVAVILVTLDIDELFELSDQIAVLNSGRLSSPEPAASMTLQSLGERMTGDGQSTLTAGPNNTGDQAARG